MKNLTQKLIREAQSPPTRCVSTQPPEVFEYDPVYKQKVNIKSLCRGLVNKGCCGGCMSFCEIDLIVRMLLVLKDFSVFIGVDLADTQWNHQGPGHQYLSQLHGG